MSRHCALATGLVVAFLLIPATSRGGDPPEGFFPEWFTSMKSKEKTVPPPLPKTLDGAVTGYLGGRMDEAEAVLKPLAAEKAHDEDYPLYALTLGSLALSLGDYQSTERSLSAALVNMVAELDAPTTGLALVQTESERPYRGYPHEKMLAHIYLGLAHFQQSRHEDARIEFAKAREVHRGAKAGQEDDFATGHFLEGLNSLRSESFNSAQVSFRKVTELQKDWPLGWYALCRASELADDPPEAEEAWARYDALAPAESRLARDGSTPIILFLIESGLGPTRKPSEIVDQIGEWQATESPKMRVTLASANQSEVEAPILDDLYFQASTQGGLGGEAARKVVSSIAKAGVRKIPLLGGWLAGKSEVDTRCWATTPGVMRVAAVRTSEQPTSVELRCSQRSGAPKASSPQVFRFLRGRPFEQAPVVYQRIVSKADS